MPNEQGSSDLGRHDNQTQTPRPSSINNDPPPKDRAPGSQEPGRGPDFFGRVGRVFGRISRGAVKDVVDDAAAGLTEAVIDETAFRSLFEGWDGRWMQFSGPDEVRSVARRLSAERVRKMIREGNVLTLMVCDRARCDSLDGICRERGMEIGYARQCLAMSDCVVEQTRSRLATLADMLDEQGGMGLDVFQAQVIAGIRDVAGEMLPQYIVGRAEQPAGVWDGPVHVVGNGNGGAA